MASLERRRAATDFGCRRGGIWGGVHASSPGPQGLVHVRLYTSEVSHHPQRRGDKPRICARAVLQLCRRSGAIRPSLSIFRVPSSADTLAHSGSRAAPRTRARVERALAYLWQCMSVLGWCATAHGATRMVPYLGCCAAAHGACCAQPACSPLLAAGGRCACSLPSLRSRART